MALRRNVEFEGAVEALLCPRHYEYLLFIQDKLEREKNLDGSAKYRQAHEVMKIVHAASPLLPALNVSEAIDILHEAVHRLK